MIENGPGPGFTPPGRECDSAQDEPVGWTPTPPCPQEALVAEALGGVQLDLVGGAVGERNGGPGMEAAVLS